MGDINGTGTAALPCILAGAAAFALAVGAVGQASAETPASGLKLAKEFKVSAEAMAKWEDEHKVPAAWIAGAKKTGQLRVSGTNRPRDFNRLVAPFSERYPFLKIDYTRGSRNTRVIKPIIAYREGRIITDVVDGLNTGLALFQKAGALTNLSDLPNRANIPAKFAVGDKPWILARLRYYCLAYNTKLVKKSELPKTWDDLKNSTALQDRKTALWSGVGAWLLPLWGEKGPEWTSQFIRDVYGKLKPERRKEGMTALTALTGAGEFKATLAVAAYMVTRVSEKGAPVAFHCPDTVMVNPSVMGLIKGSPNTDAGKLFLNWLLSLEGQLSQYRHNGARPIHKALQTKQFVPFPEEVLGKPLAFHDPGLQAADLPKLMKVWDPFWKAAGGPKGERKKRKRKSN
ncbi:MAG: extracellular solute-binding protein [Alphaproteobacteria bacterium]|nr:extracellular solute-binding protein [Alphaproteobacteria bacterium]